jgi:pyrimidine operon attenuation protein/uracil phosphoribosyltransferase
MDAILDFGRPRKILLAVLVDRGRRELPIEAQYIGKKIATSTTEIVSVTFRETDREDDVWLLDREAAKAPRPAPRRARARHASPRRGPRKK